MTTVDAMDDLLKKVFTEKEFVFEIDGSEEDGFVVFGKWNKNCQHCTCFEFWLYNNADNEMEIMTVKYPNETNCLLSGTVLMERLIEMGRRLKRAKNNIKRHERYLPS
jgi:hypothetical protein